MPLVVTGALNNQQPEVNPFWSAEHVARRPADCLGSYSLANGCQMISSQGFSIGGSTIPYSSYLSSAGSPPWFPLFGSVVFAMQWTDPNSVFVLKKFNFKLAGFTGVTGGQGMVSFQLFRASSFIRQFDQFNYWLSTTGFAQAAQTYAIGTGNRRKSTMPVSRANGGGSSPNWTEAYNATTAANTPTPILTAAGNPATQQQPSSVQGGNIVCMGNPVYTSGQGVAATVGYGGGYWSLQNAQLIGDRWPFSCRHEGYPYGSAMPQWNGGIGLTNDQPLYDSTDTYPQVFGPNEGFFCQLNGVSTGQVQGTTSLYLSPVQAGYQIGCNWTLDWEEYTSY